MHFRFAEIMELPPSSWRQASVHRTLAFDCSNPSLLIKNAPIRWMSVVLMVEMEGFVAFPLCGNHGVAAIKLAASQCPPDTGI
ncbi:MAG: hypothetical protein ACI3V0_01085 [Faecousia sp.]